jgi:putative copper resistance protein D
LEFALGLAARWATFSAILIVIGAVAFRWLVLGRAPIDADSFDQAAGRSARIGGIAALTILPAALIRLGLQVTEMRFPGDPWTGVAAQLLSSTEWGMIWSVQIAAALGAALAFVIARRGLSIAWLLLIVLGAVLAATTSLSSHAMSVEGRRWISVPSDLLHVTGAGLWLGTLAVMYSTAERAPSKSAARHGSAHVAALLSRFSPLALIGATSVAVSGVVSALVHLEHPLAMLASTWGELLALKLVAVLAVVFLGWRNWRHHTPDLREAGANAIWRGMRAELLATLVVLILTSALVVSSPPMAAMMPMP